MTDETDGSRRRFLHLAGAAAAMGLAGCAGPAATESPTPSPTGTPEPVPSEYRTATALGGTERNPEGLSTKEAVDYQPEPNEGERCSGCQFYVEDKNGDGQGACAIVEGVIDPNGWCVSYVPLETG